MGRYDDDDEYDDEEEEIEYVLFQGAVNGVEANLRANARLAQAGLLPAKELVSDGLARRAQTIAVEPKGDRAGVRLVIDGIAYPGGRLPGRRAMAITQMLKLLAGLDPKDRKTAQAGGVKATFEEAKYVLRVETTPIGGGAERLMIRVEDIENPLTKPADAGYPDELKEKVRKYSSTEKGLILVCGPKGSGTSTTAFVTLHAFDSYIYSIFSIANVGGRELFNITEFDYEPGDDLDAIFLRANRKEADIMMVDPVRDAATIMSMLKAREELSMAFLAEIPADDPVLALQQVIDWVQDSEAVNAGLRCIITQRLVRVLCPTCREAYRPNKKMMARVGLPPETKVLYREATPPDPEDEEEEEPEICEDCDGLGYRGQAAAFELLELSEGMQKLISEGAGPAEFKKQMRADGMLTLQIDALRLVAEGKTSLEEVQRVFAPKRKKKPRRR